MEPSAGYSQELLALDILLERGIQSTQQGRHVEAVLYFSRALEQLSPDQFYYADALDNFIQSHTRYSQAQEALHTASKRFVEADAEQQSQLAALEKLLPVLREEMDRTPQPRSTAQPSKNSFEPLTPQLPFNNFDDGQPSQSSHTLRKDSDILPSLYITCFGRFEVRRLNQQIPPCPSHIGQSIFRYLVGQPDHSATIDTLMALLWPEDEPDAAQPKLHSAISALRRSLNHGYKCKPGCGYILCKNRNYFLNPVVVIRTDVDEFLQWYEADWKTDEQRVTHFEKACSLYKGIFLLEDLYADWSFLQREHLNRVYLTMCRALTDYYLKSTCYENAAKWATAILKVNRCDEEAHRQLIQIYVAQGRRIEALQQYHRCESLLREELGVTPLPETTQVFQKLLTNVPFSADTAEIQ